MNFIFGKLDFQAADFLCGITIGPGSGLYIFNMLRSA
jgi:hypothetical protein